MKRYIKKFATRALASLILGLGAIGQAQAANTFLIENPAQWRLQKYIPGPLAIWYTGAPCTNGQLLLPNAATDEDRQLLWDTVTTAKHTDERVFIYYDEERVAGRCTITSFGLDRGAQTELSTGGVNLELQTLTLVSTGWGAEAIYVRTQEDFPAPSEWGCQQPNVYQIARGSAMFEAKLSMLLSALHTGRQVRLYVNGCSGPYVKLLGVQLAQ